MFEEDDDFPLTLEDADGFDVDRECGPDLNKWTDGEEAEKDSQ